MDSTRGRSGSALTPGGNLSPASHRTRSLLPADPSLSVRPRSVKPASSRRPHTWGEAQIPATPKPVRRTRAAPGGGVRSPTCTAKPARTSHRLGETRADPQGLVSRTRNVLLKRSEETDDPARNGQGVFGRLALPSPGPCCRPQSPCEPHTRAVHRQPGESAPTLKASCRTWAQRPLHLHLRPAS